MADMAVIIGSDAAVVHLDMVIVQGLELGLIARACIVDLNCHLLFPVPLLMGHKGLEA